MSYRRLLRPFAISAVTLCLSIAPASAQQFQPTGRDTLRDLPGVEVMVEPLEPPLSEAGLNAREIRADVVSQLRAGSIAVYASQTDNPSSAKPYVYIQLVGVAAERQTLAIELQVHLRQTLRSPVTGSNIVNAMTWDQHTVMVVPRGQMNGVRSGIREAVAAFVSDWRAVH
jgi:hypothetical protein